LEDASRTCCADLGSILAERKRHKTSRLALHKELGGRAVQLLRSTSQAGEEVVLTQWSDVLRSGLATAEQAQHDRAIASLMDKGDAKAWDELIGHKVVMRAPEDANAVTRLLATFLRRAQPAQRPASIRLAAPILLMPGMTTPSQIMDLWWSPLLCDKWAPVVRGCTFTTTPLDMILPGRDVPRHVRMGLAVFTLGHDGDRLPPRMVEAAQPLLRVDDVKAAVVDVRVDQLSLLLQAFSGPYFQDVVLRDPTRSPLSTAEVPRVELHLVFPRVAADLDILMLLQRIRTTSLGERHLLRS